MRKPKFLGFFSSLKVLRERGLCLRDSGSPLPGVISHALFDGWVGLILLQLHHIPPL